MKKYMTTFFNIQHSRHLGLNPTDLFILDWVYRFAFTGKMYSRRLREESTGKMMTFYWINYRKLLDDFNGGGTGDNFLPFDTRKSLREYFDRYIAKGIFYKRIEYSVSRSNDGKDSETSRGTYTFFAINVQVYEYLTGEGDVQDLDLSTGTNEICTEKEKLSTGKEDLSTEKADLYTGDEHTEHRGDKHQCTAPLNAEVLPNIYKLEDNKAIRQDKDSTSDVEEYLYSLFGGDKEVITKAFASNLLKYLDECGIKTPEDKIDYIRSSYDYCLSRSPRRVDSYFKVIVQKKERITTFMHKRFNDVTQNNLKNRKDTCPCPVCSTYHLISSDCPTCGLHDRFDDNEIREKRIIYNFDPVTKSLFNSSLSSLYPKDSLDFTKIQEFTQKKKELYRKFGVCA